MKKPEVEATYRRGEQKMYQIVLNHMQYPEEAAEADEQGIVIIKFIIDRKGNAYDFSIVKSSGSELIDNEVLRVCSKYLAKGWIPAKDHRKAVVSEKVIGLRFRLD